MKNNCLLSYIIVLSYHSHDTCITKTFSFPRSIHICFQFTVFNESILANETLFLDQNCNLKLGYANSHHYMCQTGMLQQDYIIRCHCRHTEVPAHILISFRPKSGWISKIIGIFITSDMSCDNREGLKDGQNI